MSFSSGYGCDFSGLILFLKYRNNRLIEHGFTRSGSSNQIHQPMSLFKLCAFYIVSLFQSHPKTNILLDTFLLLLPNLTNMMFNCWLKLFYCEQVSPTPCWPTVTPSPASTQLSFQSSFTSSWEPPDMFLWVSQPLLSPL